MEEFQHPGRESDYAFLLNTHKGVTNSSSPELWPKSPIQGRDSESLIATSRSCWEPRAYLTGDLQDGEATPANGNQTSKIIPDGLESYQIPRIRLKGAETFP
jgi:hypothetical protein